MDTCPKCARPVDSGAVECSACGVVLAKARAATPRPEPTALAPPVPSPARPPVAQAPGRAQDVQRLRNLAAGSCLVPLAVGAINALTKSVGASSAETLGRAVGIVVLYALGLAVGIYALLQVRRVGRAGVFGYALAGTLLNGLLLLILTTVFLSNFGAAVGRGLTAEVTSRITPRELFDGRVVARLACQPEELAKDTESIAPGVLRNARCSEGDIETDFLLYDVAGDDRMDLETLTQSLLDAMRQPLIRRGATQYEVSSKALVSKPPGQARSIRIHFELKGVTTEILGRSLSDGADAAIVLTTYVPGVEPGDTLARQAMESFTLRR